MTSIIAVDGSAGMDCANDAGADKAEENQPTVNSFDSFRSLQSIHSIYFSQFISVNSL